MRIDPFIYSLHIAGASGKPETFLGTAFPISRGGGLLTCRHVVDIAVPPDGQIVAANRLLTRIWPVKTIKTVDPLDIAYLPDVVTDRPNHLIPILTPERTMIGNPVHTYGYFALGKTHLEEGYFSGTIVNLANTLDPLNPTANDSITLPFPIIEGMSGCPLLTDYNGPKVVGVGYMNVQSRVLAHEYTEITEKGERFTEAVHRVIEFGRAYHSGTILNAAPFLGLTTHVESHARIGIPDLD